MIAYLIDAKRRLIEPIDYAYESIRQWFTDGIAIAAPFPTGDVLYVGDEGLLRPATVAFRIKRRRDGQPMMSNGFLTGRDNPDPRRHDTLPPVMTMEELAAEIEWLDLDTALAWFRERSDQPALVEYDRAGRKTVLATWGGFLRNLEGHDDGYRPH